MSAADPIALLSADRASARDAGDAMANLCVLATAGADAPEARTLVLRDVEDRLALFFNASSPKAAEVARSSTVAVLVYLPSLSRQYRVRATLEPIPAHIVHANWKLRPDVPKKMDWLYARHAQSSVMASREVLIDALESTTPERAPQSAIGFYLAPLVVERLDLGQANGVHDRRRYTRREALWQEEVLVP